MSELIQHYESLFDTHGGKSVESVQAASAKQQNKRFEILFEMGSDMSSILDVGCGLGHMLKFMQSSNLYSGKINYLGVDFVPSFIDYCKKNLSSDLSNFQRVDLNHEGLPEGRDYCLLSGVFNNVMPHNDEFMKSALKKMFDASKKGIAFNALSTYVDYQDDKLYYSNPAEIFDFCKTTLSGRVVLRHEYQTKPNVIPFEYTIYVYKD
jgi:SAM-dependent methyltransferase